jgi:hypothetical protein
MDELSKLQEVWEEDRSDQFGTARWMEASTAARVRVRDLNGSFQEYLVRTRPKIVSENVNVREVYSFQRSIGQGSTSQARNQYIPSDVIDGSNMQRSQETAK